MCSGIGCIKIRALVEKLVGLVKSGWVHINKY